MCWRKVVQKNSRSRAGLSFLRRKRSKVFINFPCCK